MLWLAGWILGPGVSLWPVLLGFFVVVAANGFLFVNLSAMAVGSAGARAGSGSALLGAAQMVAAALVAPLTGIGDGHSAVPMVVVMMVAAAVVMLVLPVLRRHHGRDV